MQETEAVVEHDLHHLHLFDGYGIELEYMIVDTAQFDILPLADKVLYSIAGQLRIRSGAGKTALVE